MVTRSFSSCLSTVDFWFDAIMGRDYPLYNFSSSQFVEACCMTPEVTHLDDYLMGT